MQKRVYVPDPLLSRIEAIRETYRQRGLVIPSVQQLTNQALESGLPTIEAAAKGSAS